MATLQDILINSNSYLDLAAELPSGDDLDVRIDYAKQAVREWADSYRWKELSTPATIFATLGTVSLANFKELEAVPVDYFGNEYPEIRPADRTQKKSVIDIVI